MNTLKTGQQSVVDRVPLPDVIVAVFALLIVGIFGLTLCPLHLSTGLGLGLDDGWIHLAFAKNLFHRHIWSINPTGSSGGATSILWVLLLAPGFAFTDNGPAWNIILNTAIFVWLAVLIRRVWCELVSNPRTAFVLTLLTLTAGNLVWFVFSGMETLLTLALGLATFHFWASGRTRLAVIFALFSALVRPEGILVPIAIFVISLSLSFRGRRYDGRLKSSFLIFLSGLLALAITCLWNYHLTGTILPSTLTGRRWLIDVSQSQLQVFLHSPISLLRLVGVWGYRLMEFTFGQGILASWGLPAGTSWILAAAAILVAVIGLIVYLSRISLRTGSILVWAVLQLIVFSMILPTRGHAGRYQPAVLLAAVIFFWLGISFLWSITVRGRVVLIGLSILVMVSLYTWNVILRQSLLNFDRIHIAAARWIADHTPADAPVAALDIGAMAYFADRPIVDLGGLVDSQSGQALYNRTIPDYIRRHGAMTLALVLPHTDPEVYFHQMALDRLFAAGVLKFQVDFGAAPPDPDWAGEAARVLASKIRIYAVQWDLQN